MISPRACATPMFRAALESRRGLSSSLRLGWIAASDSAIVAGLIRGSAVDDQDLEAVGGVILVDELLDRPRDEPGLVPHRHDHRDERKPIGSRPGPHRLHRRMRRRRPDIGSLPDQPPGPSPPSFDPSSAHRPLAFKADVIEDSRKGHGQDPGPCRHGLRPRGLPIAGHRFHRTAAQSPFPRYR